MIPHYLGRGQTMKENKILSHTFQSTHPQKKVHLSDAKLKRMFLVNTLGRGNRRIVRLAHSCTDRSVVESYLYQCQRTAIKER